MTFYGVIIVCACIIFRESLVSCKESEHLNNIKIDVLSSEQESAVMGLIMRITPERAKLFVVKIDSSIGPSGKDSFILESVQDKLVITGTSGVALAVGFNHFLKYYCNSHISSWASDQVSIPFPLPTVKKIQISTLEKFRYYQNVCTVSYSSVFWNWTRWEQEIDWMALNGINLPLAFTGQEALWNRVFIQLGFSQEEIDSFFGGPAFLAWARMGNLQGWGGPLSTFWKNGQLKLQYQILKRMRSFGMMPVLPAFAGFVPHSFLRLFPNSSLSYLHWGSLKAPYRDVALLNFSDPMFSKIGVMFLKEVVGEFGTNHFYSADTFNEMAPPRRDEAYFVSAGSAVYRAMRYVDQDAVWLMQSWLFLSNVWTPSAVRAYVTSVPIGRLLVLDLHAEEIPLYQHFESFYGQPFIWAMLHNFGGTLGFFGSMDKVQRGLATARHYANSTIVGTGITMEGINQNYVAYEFMNELAWRSDRVDLGDWLALYSARRYGSANLSTTWRNHLLPVFNASRGFYHLGALVSQRPRLGFSPSKELWYNPKDVFLAWDDFMGVLKDLAPEATFRYDLVDVTRQSLQLLSAKFYTDIGEAYTKQSLSLLSAAGKNMSTLMKCLDSVLNTDPHFMIGPWIASARALGSSQSESDWLEYNARTQITTWGPNGEILDYAAKQWGGWTERYMIPRWNIFLSFLAKSISTKKPFDAAGYQKEVFEEAERAFTLSREPFPLHPVGNFSMVAEKVYSLLRPFASDAYFRNVQFGLHVLSSKDNVFNKYAHFTTVL